MARNEPDSPLERRLAGERQTLARALRTLVRRAPVVCAEQTIVRDALAVMHREGIGSIVVVDARERPVGIFTERDLIGVAIRTAGLSQGANSTPSRGLGAPISAGLDGPMAEAMTRDPLALPGHTPAYDAALAMIDHRIRHVLVTEGDALIGVVSERDLFSLQRLGLGELTVEIRLARDTPALAGIAARVRRLTRLLVEQGVAAEPLTLFVSVLNDRLCQRVIEIVRNRHRWERIGWCWLAFGSEGRLEQTFATDQDNGLVFETHDEARPAEARAKLLPFAHEVNEALDACGYPLCKGNVMASNPELCLSVAEWQAKIEGWLHHSDPKALLDATICLDFRALHGDSRLATTLREWLLGRARSAANFLRLMAENALEARPPLGKWRGFATENAPNAPNTINLKLYGARPFVDTARIMALARGVPQTSTAERLRAASAAGALPRDEAEAAVASFHFIHGIRLRHQASLEDPGGEAVNRIDPSRLNELDRRTLKEAFRIARDLQARLALDYEL